MLPIAAIYRLDTDTPRKCGSAAATQKSTLVAVGDLPSVSEFFICDALQPLTMEMILMQFCKTMLVAAAMLTATQASAAGDESDTLSYFVGDWRCGVQNADGALDPNGFSTASTEELRNGWFATWILAFHDGTSDKMLASMRYDATREQYVIFLKDDNGSYGMGTAKGWNVHALEFKGTLHKADGADVDFTKTFTILDGGKFSLAWQFADKDAEPSLICQK